MSEGLKYVAAPVASLEEKVVHLGLIEGVAQLKASLESKTVLTDVFLSKDMQLAYDSNERGSDSYDGR
ncbi:hypothetical protein Ancab_015015 [Ancistrocladus abbreviatus]